MNNLLTAIFSKISGSSFSSDVCGRVYLDSAPDNCELPYCVVFIVSGIPERTFTEHYSDVLIQFSIFSASSGAAEITTIYNNLKALFDEQTLTISSVEAFWIREANLTTMVDDVLVSDAMVGVKHYAVDFEILSQET